MPTTVIKNYAQKSGNSEKRVEELWKKSKEIVNKQYPDIEKGSSDYYRLVNGILKIILKLNESTVSGDISQYIPPLYDDSESFSQWLKRKGYLNIV